jgi:hypothetical protein
MSELIQFLLENDIVQARYKPGETVGSLKYKLSLPEEYTMQDAQLCYSGEAIPDTRLIQDFAYKKGPLDLKMADMGSSRAASQNGSSHSYQGLQSEGSSRQYVGNIGVLSGGSSFGSHRYNDIKSSGDSKQVLGDMASFPPGL